MNFDCLLQIFNYLILKDSSKCSLVCKDWLSVFYSHARLNQTGELLITWRHVHNIFLTCFKNYIVNDKVNVPFCNYSCGFLSRLGLTILCLDDNSIILQTHWHICVRICFPPKFQKPPHFLTIPTYQRDHDSFVVHFCDQSKLLIDFSNILKDGTISINELSIHDEENFRSYSFDEINIYNNHWTPYYTNILCGGTDRFQISHRDRSGQIVWKRTVKDIQPFVGFFISSTTWYVIIEWVFVLFKFNSSKFWLINVENTQQSGMIDFSLISPYVTFKRFDKSIASWYVNNDLWLFDDPYRIAFQCCWISTKKCWNVKKHSMNCSQLDLLKPILQCPISNKLIRIHN